MKFPKFAPTSTFFNVVNIGEFALVDLYRTEFLVSSEGKKFMPSSLEIVGQTAEAWVRLVPLNPTPIPQKSIALHLDQLCLALVQKPTAKEGRDGERNGHAGWRRLKDFRRFDCGNQRPLIFRVRIFLLDARPEEPKVCRPEVG